jgi:serine protease Do
MSLLGGALVSEVVPGSPAARAGVRNGDVITAFGGRAIADSRILSRLVAEAAAGRGTDIEVFRNGQKESFEVVVAELDNSPPVTPTTSMDSALKTFAGLSDLGLALAQVDGKLRAQYRLGSGIGGVVITGVASASAAGEKDLRPGDVILEVQNENVDSPDEVFYRVAASAKSGRKAVLFRIRRNGQTNYVALPLGGTG